MAQPVSDDDMEEADARQEAARLFVAGVVMTFP
jgi:hypothetical protein